MLFENLLEKIKFDVIKFLLNINIVFKDDMNSENIKDPQTAKKVGRNEKCPCGSGKKYKHCCGSV